MQNTVSIKYNRDFKRLYYKGKSLAAGYLVLYYRKTGQNGNKLGITVSKKLGCAVKRNRVRRLIKECYRLREAYLNTGYQLVFVARTRAVGCSFEQINRDMGYLLKKSGLCMQDSGPGMVKTSAQVYSAKQRMERE